MSPYRTAAEMPPEPKPKRQFKMPSIKLGKHSKTLGFLLPVSGAAVAVGLIYDAPLLGLGFKWGSSIGLLVIAAFFIGMMFNNLENG